MVPRGQEPEMVAPPAELYYAGRKHSDSTHSRRPERRDWGVRTDGARGRVGGQHAERSIVNGAGEKTGGVRRGKSFMETRSREK